MGIVLPTPVVVSTDEGFAAAWSSEAEPRWDPLLAMVRAVLADRSVYDGILDPGERSGAGWAVCDVEVEPEVRERWRAFHAWTDEDAAEDPLQFCSVHHGPHRGILTRDALEQILWRARSQVEAVAAEAARADRIARRVAWVASLPRAPIQWAIVPPSAADRDRLIALEAAAAAVDASSDPEDPRAGLPARQALLQDLHAAGVFDPDEADVRLALLHHLALPILAGYAEAASDLHAYLASDVRLERNPGAIPVPILASPISIDWFRLGPYVGGVVDPAAWVAWGESQGAFGREPDQDGVIYWSSGGASETFVYRLDVPGLAPLLRVGRPVPGAKVRPSDAEGPLDATRDLERIAARLLELDRAHSDAELLEAVISVLVVRLGAVSVASGWYLLGLAALLRSQLPDGARWRSAAFGALRRAAREDPGHAGAIQLLAADADTPPIEGSPASALARAPLSPTRWEAVLGRLAPDVRGELLRAIARPVVRNARLLPALTFALQPMDRQQAQGRVPVDRFTQRYVLKRVLGHAPTDREILRPALAALASSPDAGALQPYLRLAIEGLGEPRRWWQVWRR